MTNTRFIFFFLTNKYIHESNKLLKLEAVAGILGRYMTQKKHKRFVGPLPVGLKQHSDEKFSSAIFSRLAPAWSGT